ncbi:DUF3375 family protein [Oerskovia paurometabola]|uniref:DUF3375 family protein n=1 Tax=Oerskovia paurometabola TaxID=162170 RepID=UPI003810B858
MSDVLGQYARVRTAFQQPTLTLLNRQYATATVTLFRTCFNRESAAVETSRLHQLVDNLLVDLRNAGAAVPDQSGRELCQRWVKGGWLNRVPDEALGEVYVQSAGAQTALSLVENLEQDRPTLSEHRISTIVDAVRRFNASANPSREARVQILDTQIEALVTERERLRGGGEIPAVSADYMVEGYVELLGLISALPSDFQRVTERFEQIRRDILERFRSEEHTAGTVIDTYLSEAERLTTSTAEGRAFEGAFALLRNDAVLMQLRADIDALLDHPHADVLADAEKRALRSTVLVVQRSLDDVLAQRSKATKTIKDYITIHDIARDRQLDQTLRALDAQFGPWLARTNTRTRVPLPLLPEVLDIDHLPRRFHDPQGSVPPIPLRNADVEDAQTTDTLAEMIAWGGPSLQALATALAEAVESGSVGEMFNSLDPSLRRPVDVLGILHLADSLNDASGEVELEEFEALRPDGTSRTFVTTRTPLPPRTTLEDDE